MSATGAGSSSPSGLPPIRVLIVDDEALVRLRVHDLLRDEHGVDVVGEAADGDAAIKAIRELKRDLVFLEMQMPKKSWLDVVKAIGAEQMPMTTLQMKVGVRRRVSRSRREGPERWLGITPRE